MNIQIDFVSVSNTLHYNPVLKIGSIGKEIYKCYKVINKKNIVIIQYVMCELQIQTFMCSFSGLMISLVSACAWFAYCACHSLFYSGLSSV